MRKLKVITQERFDKMMDLHKKFLSGESDVGCADLSYCDLRNVNFINANLSYANLFGTDLRGTNLRGIDLLGTDLINADLRDTDLSGAQNLVSPIYFMDSHFERTTEGYIAYKTFGGQYPPPKKWEIVAGAIIEEVVNPERQCGCGCGINVAPLEWVKRNYKGNIWKVLIEWPWLAGVVVPYGTDGKIRCEKVRLLEVVKE